MKTINDLTHLIVACWRLGGDDEEIPTSHGLLDRALRDAVVRDAFPQWARDALHFVDARIGLHCVELPDILDWAQRSELTKAPNPSYSVTEVQISDRLALLLLRNLGVGELDARKWGELLRKTTQDARRALAS
ncbi:MAG: hypothetical protein HY049_10125 [Acidobacteria bacterium]|nr:hypothetical protein [Acidobacteriota bacterium]